MAISGSRNHRARDHVAGADAGLEGVVLPERVELAKSRLEDLTNTQLAKSSDVRPPPPRVFLITMLQETDEEQLTNAVTFGAHLVDLLLCKAYKKCCPGL